MTVDRAELKVWKTVLLLLGALSVLAIGGAYVYLNFIAQNQLDEKYASWQEGVYENTALKLRFTAPTGWEHQDADAMAQAQSEANSAAGLAEEESKERPLFTAYEPTWRSYITMTAQYVEGEATTAAIDEALLQSLTMMGQQYGAGAYTIDEPQTLTVAGREWQARRLLLPQTGTGAEIWLLGAVSGDYLISISITALTEDDPLSLLDCFTTTATK